MVISVGGAQGTVGILHEGCWVVQVRLQTLVREHRSSVALYTVNRSYGASRAAPLFLGWMMYNTLPAARAANWISVEHRMLKEPRRNSHIRRDQCHLFSTYCSEAGVGLQCWPDLDQPAAPDAISALVSTGPKTLELRRMPPIGEFRGGPWMDGCSWISSPKYLMLSNRPSLGVYPRITSGPPRSSDEASRSFAFPRLYFPEILV